MRSPHRTLVLAISTAIALSTVSLANDPPGVEWYSADTVAEVGRTRVIAFQIDEPAAGDLTLEATVDGSARLDIIAAPAVLEGETIGFVRVRGLEAGPTTLTIGDHPIEIEVVEPRTTAYARKLTPRVVSPADGAAVWGRITVGVQQREDSLAAPPELKLRLPGGEVMEPVTERSRRIRPLRHAVFELDANGLPTGPLELIPVSVAGGGTETIGAPVTVLVVHPAPSDVTEGEAEGRYDVERPERFADDRRLIGSDENASGGAFFANSSALPAVCFPVRVPEPGWYQLALVASGSMAGGALPNVSFVVDGAQYGATDGSLVTEHWHRLTIGVPVRLERGTRLITPYFTNDFFAPGLADRNLRLDRIEVLRVPRPAATRARLDGGEGGGSMMDGMAGMTGAGMPGGLESRAADAMGLSGHPVRIALNAPIDGAVVAGELELRGSCWAEGTDPRQDPLRTPTVTLLINDRRVASQRTLAPRFWIDASEFAPGANTIQLVARLESGARAETPVQTVTYLGEQREQPATARRALRYSIHEPGWDDSLRGKLANKHYPVEGNAAVFSSNAEATLALPDDLEGTFEVYLHLLGEHFDGAPIADVRLITGDGSTEIGSIEAPTWWNTASAGTVTLGAGPKRIGVRFANDHYVAGRGDRNLYLQELILRETSDAIDTTSPCVRLSYPHDDHDVYMADAVVCDVWDDTAVHRVALLIDEVEMGVDTWIIGQPGRVVLPILARELDPGVHTISVRVTDGAGNVGVSGVRRIQVLPEAPDRPGPYRRALHMLDRFAFGPDRAELGAILTTGEDAWLDDRLSRRFEDNGELAAAGLGLVRFPGYVGPYQVAQRAIDHALRTPNPVRARFVLWVQNHFSTWARKSEGGRKWVEHIEFSEIGPAPFLDLLATSAESPAMLRYLDQDQSFRRQLNENYAREIMELHTLGVDAGYTQEDVTSLARVLTGWRAVASRDRRAGGTPGTYEFRFDPTLNDGREARVFGMQLASAQRDERYDRIQASLEMLAAHPSTARFISRKLAEHYIGPAAPDQVVDDLTLVFHESGGDLREVLKAIAAHPAFWASTSDRRLAHPVDFVMRLFRTSGHDNPWQAGQYLQRSGAGLFDCSSPDGYPEADEAYTDSNAMLQRWVVAQEAMWSISSAVPGAWRNNADTNDPRWPQRVVDAIAIRLTGDVLGGESNQAAVNLLVNAAGNSQERVLLVSPLIAQLPESNLR